MILGYYYGYMYWDTYSIIGMALVLIGAVGCMIAQSKVNKAYRKYAKVANEEGTTGYQVARQILDSNGMSDVEIKEVSGTMSDHYDPRNKTVNLSSDNYRNSTIAAVAIAAHECGHAIQHHTGYKAIVFRNAMVPMIKTSQMLGWVVIMIGLMSEHFGMAYFGLALMSAILVFQLVTLPIEFDASKRALAILDGGYISSNEVYMAKDMLSAAAFTYVASFAASVFSILRILLMVISGSSRSNRK